MGCEGDANVNKCFSYRHQSNGKSRKHTSKPQNIRSIFGRFLERSRQSWINVLCTSYDKRFIRKQTPKHTKYFWAFVLALLTTWINAFVYFVRHKVYSQANPKTYEVFLGVFLSAPDDLNKRFCVLRTTKGLFMLDKRFITWQMVFTNIFYFDEYNEKYF